MRPSTPLPQPPGLTAPPPHGCGDRLKQPSGDGIVAEDPGPQGIVGVRQACGDLPEGACGPATLTEGLLERQLAGPVEYSEGVKLR